MSGRMLEDTILSTTVGIVTYQGTAAGSFGVVIKGQHYEAKDVSGLAPANGTTVLVDYLPGSSQWVIVGVI